MKLIWAPGYAILYIAYLFPKEWGKKRNVAQSGRQWKHRDVLAPIYSVIFYLVLIFLIISLVNPSNTTNLKHTVSDKGSVTATESLVDQTSVQSNSATTADKLPTNEQQINTSIYPKINNDESEDAFVKFIEGLEIEKNYFGTDQIIRCRLKLPQKKLLTSKQIEIWQTKNDSFNKDELITQLINDQCK
ncbi:MAG: hypothetical protein WCK82_12180 [Bacteroidota bacterium]